MKSLFELLSFHLSSYDGKNQNLHNKNETTLTKLDLSATDTSPPSE